MATIAEQRRQVNALILTLEPDVRAAFLESVQDITDRIILNVLIAALERGDVDAAVEALNIHRAVFAPLAEVLTSAYSQAGRLQTKFLPSIRDQLGRRVIVRWDMTNPRAETWLRELSSDMITEITEETKRAARVAITEGYSQGQGPRQIALALAGRTSRATNHREGGIVGLSGPQASAADNMRRRLTSGDPAQMSEVFDMKLRDKRFDAAIKKAIDAGKPLSAEDADKMVARYSDRALKHRADTIARTETGNAVMAARMESARQALDANGGDETAVRRRWRNSGKRTSRDTHKALNGRQVIGLSQAFVTATGARLMYPMDRSLGAPAREVCNCECTMDVIFDFSRGLR